MTSILKNLYPLRFSAFAVLILACLAFTSCVKDFNIDIKSNKPLLVVEGYVNNLMREYNYVVLSRSLDYLSVDFQSAPVGGAAVFVTEGEMINSKYVWNPATRLQLKEANLPILPANFKKGVYFDPRLVTDSARAWLGTPGKSYLLEISERDSRYSAITTLLQPVPIDSVTSGYSFIDDEDSSKLKVRLTNHYKDPDTLNNTQLYYYRFSENRGNFGWGGLAKSRTSGSDDLSNGQYIHLTHPRGFLAGDSVTYMMASVTRDVYQFWDSYNDARSNGGPFATPVVLGTNVQGENVTGCFCGLSLSAKTIIIK